jgi:D-alanine-D-alanine ligase
MDEIVTDPVEPSTEEEPPPSGQPASSAGAPQRHGGRPRRSLHVALLANLKKNAPVIPGIPEDYWVDLDSESTIEAIADGLRQGGHRVTFLEGDVTLYDRLREVRPDICFNICEGHFGDSREAQVPAILEMLRIPYTGSRVLTLALALDKPMTKRILSYHGLPTPPFQVFERADEPLDPTLTFPMFVKPSRQGTGMGITAQSIVHDEAELRAQLRSILEAYHEPALVERYISGRELTVGMVGNLTPPVAWRVPEDEDAPRVQRGLRFLPPLEIDLGIYNEAEGGVYTHHAKVELADRLNYICPAPISAELTEELNWLAAATFRVTGCLDVARVDFRLDEADGQPYILEVNPLPGLSPGISDLVIEAAAAGIGHAELVNMILDQAVARYGL